MLSTDWETGGSCLEDRLKTNCWLGLRIAGCLFAGWRTVDTVSAESV